MMGQYRMLRSAMVLGFLICIYGSVGAESPWDEVKKILSETRDIIVLDGTDRSSLRYEGDSQPSHGDWMVSHMLSDPENFNPFTSNDSGASRVHRYIFESLLYPENETPYALKGLIAKDYPTISEDRLSYRFQIREGVHFADGVPLTTDDVLFSIKVIQNPRVMAPHLRNYYASVKDVEADGPYEITFVCAEPYFRNDLMLGGMDILPKHYYDPDGLLDPVEAASLIDGSWKDGPHADRVTQFAERFNRDFNRRMLGSGPYYVADWENDVVTGQKVILTRSGKYWGSGVPGLPITGYVNRIVFKIINNVDAAFIEL
ncbi:MAG: ABC transporter substrate-binding protein, partial [Candidatus Latescibacteria bacterium]|nr:ABC transporter substrate-binding protein [Candidatus Latescibacterota bacterium]